MSEFEENILRERLNKALHSAQFAAGDLREALASAGAVQGFALLPLIAQAAALAVDIDRLLHAVQDDDRIDAAILAKAKEPTA